MGKQGESGRGASALEDRADSIMRVIKASDEDNDPHALRYYYAFGRRGVDVELTGLGHDPFTDRLWADHNAPSFGEAKRDSREVRENGKVEGHVGKLVDHLKANPGIGTRDLRNAKMMGQEALTNAIQTAEEAGDIVIQRGPGNVVRHFARDENSAGMMISEDL
jgi:hypothetical protein